MNPPNTSDLSRSKPCYEVLITPDNDLNVIELLAKHSGLNNAAIKEAMSKGGLWHLANSGDGKKKKHKRLRRKSAKLSTGDKLYFYFDAELLRHEPLKPVLVECKGDFSVWDKPCGMPMLGSKWSDHLSFERFVAVNHLGGGATFIVHRLDRWASGLVVIAHNKKAAAHLAEQFATGQTKKFYRALCCNESLAVEAFELPHLISAPIDGKASKTIIRAIKPATTLLNTSKAIGERPVFDADIPKDIYQLDVQIETGRKHQIRRHLSGLGLPIIGDRLYSKECSDLAKCNYGELDLQLRAVNLSLIYQEELCQWVLDR